MKQVELSIDGMHCENCAKRLRGVLLRSPGIREASVSLRTGDASIAYDPRLVSLAALGALIEAAGFSVRPGERELPSP